MSSGTLSVAEPCDGDQRDALITGNGTEPFVAKLGRGNNARAGLLSASASILRRGAERQQRKPLSLEPIQFGAILTAA